MERNLSNIASSGSSANTLVAVDISVGYDLNTADLLNPAAKNNIFQGPNWKVEKEEQAWSDIYWEALEEHALVWEISEICLRGRLTEARFLVCWLHHPVFRDESGHKGQEGSYRCAADRNWWDNMHVDIKTHVRTSERCQPHFTGEEEEALHPTWEILLWHKNGLDIVYVPNYQGKLYLLIARDDLLDDTDR